MIKFFLPSIGNGDYSGAVLGNAEEDGLGEVEVELRRVAPPSRRAEVSGGDGDGAREAPLRVIDAPELETCPAAQPVVEQCSAQCRCVCPITLAVQVSVPTSPTCEKFFTIKA